ncbi:MAG: DnaD domain protein [Erysipelotrichaceae bacterium]|nr:DnaD domain protein [Erysipelotrichaceae bacterium]
MKKWYQERYFSRRDWLLENMNRLEISPTQGLILLLIDYYQEGRQVVTMENLAMQCHLDLEEIDAAIDDLVKMDYLVISTKNRKVYFDISGVFEDRPKLEVSRDLFEVFEEEFGRPLSQKEMIAISQWQQSYDSKTIIKALREAVIQEKLSTSYIDRILENWSRNGKV